MYRTVYKSKSLNSAASQWVMVPLKQRNRLKFRRAIVIISGLKSRPSTLRKGHRGKLIMAPPFPHPRSKAESVGEMFKVLRTTSRLGRPELLYLAERSLLIGEFRKARAVFFPGGIYPQPCS